MTVIKINAITVPSDSGDELARRFAARAGAIDNQPGFEGFELLEPTDGRTQWLVVTRWRDEESFQSWMNSPAFAQGHRGPERPDQSGGPGPERPDQSGGPGPERPDQSGGPEPERPDQSAGPGPEPQRPVGVSLELWSYVVAGRSEA